MVTPFEKPERIDLIIRHLEEVGFTGINVMSHGIRTCSEGSPADYLQFLRQPGRSG